MPQPLTFGLFPLGLAGSPDGVAAGPPDDVDQIVRAVQYLQGDGPPLLARMYVSWTGGASTASTLAQVQELAAAQIPWDLVLCYRDPAGDVAGWAEFAADVARGHGHQLAAIQVTGEANLTGIPDAADGAFPRADEALVRGMLAAADAKRDSGATAAIGFAVSPEVNPAGNAFWPAVARLGGPAFADAVDYAGLDMYPDVFGPPVTLDRLDGAVDWLLRSFREEVLPITGIGPGTPIRICENGWPTGPGRTPEQQADVLEIILRAVHARREELNVTHWELFTLRDADSSNDGLFHQFGVLRDDYSPKPAFERLRGLFRELR
ncbi:MAG TPA: hypothetical protein VIK57_15110 [Streptosporangiaceae bacterium]